MSLIVPNTASGRAAVANKTSTNTRVYLNKAQQDELLMEIARAPDTRKALLKVIRPAISGMVAFHNKILVATYIAPELTAGGVYLTAQTVKEDRFQGKVGVVAAKGPLAFKDDHIAKFGGADIQVGDFCMYRPSDGIEFFLYGIPCRWLDDARILCKLEDPQSVY
jgi:co-chaperonin GroES (HSP10)